MYRLTGKTALVTGAAGRQGIGRAIALRLAHEGADIAVNDLHATPELTELAAEITALGRKSLAIAADVSQAEQVEQMVARTAAHFGRIDILVNNAGAPAGKDRVPVVELEEAAFDLVQDVNVKGTFLCCRAAARVMIAQGQGGRIINMSSTSGRQGVARFAAYCASKFAVRGFTQALALELGAHQITVNAICPGLVATERIDDMAAALRPPNIAAAAYRAQMIEQAASSSPLGRITDTAAIAQMAAFLASDQADFLTGLSLTVAGGMMMD